MTAPTYHLHDNDVVHQDTGLACTSIRAVPAVVLTASDEDVERLARELAEVCGIPWEKTGDDTRNNFRRRVRRALEALLTPPIPPEPTDLAWRGVDRHGVTWARFADGWGCPEDSETYPWADLWSERGPLREVE